MHGGLALAAAPAIIIPGRAQAAGRRLVVANFGGAIGEAKRAVFYAPFTKATGIEIVAASGLDLAKMKLQTQSRQIVWDVVDLLPGWLPTALRLGMLERLDDRIVKRDGCLPAARSPFAVGASIYSSGIGFVTARNGRGVRSPRNWREFWDVRRFPGRRTLLRRVTDLVEIALMADGVPASQIYPCDIDRAFRALDRIKPHIGHWVAHAEQTVSFIQQDETDFSQTYSSRVKAMQAAGAPIGYSFDQNLMGVLWTGIMKGAPAGQAAQRFAAFVASPARQVALSNLTGDAPTYPQAIKHVDVNVRRWLPRIDHPDSLFTNAFWWDKRIDQLTVRFQDWLFS